MIMNLTRILELALRFPATRRVTYDATNYTAKLIIKKYDDLMDSVAWELAKDRYKKQQENNE
jgi:hypothetical protein